jgi:hypothetical protein
VAGQLAAGELTGAGRPAGADGFALASPADDAQLRALLRRTPMEGAVRVAFTREPDYFAGADLAGAQDRTLVHHNRGRIDGFGRLSINTLHRNGAPRRIGYLGELRAEPRTEHAPRHLRRGYALLREFIGADELDGCFTSIAGGNTRARRVLELGGRLGLPAYAPIAALVTLLLPVGRAARPSGVQQAEDRNELTDFLARHARAAQLTLTWDDDRWIALARHGVSPADFHVVREGGRIVAAGAVWDQRDVRQVVVTGYSGPLRWARPVVNVLAAFGAAPPLPAPGSVMRQGMIFGSAVPGPRHWPALLDALRGTARERGLDWLVLGREARDPELVVLRQLRNVREYHTQLYDVRWSDMAPWPEPWNGSLFRPEVALL